MRRIKSLVVTSSNQITTTSWKGNHSKMAPYVFSEVCQKSTQKMTFVHLSLGPKICCHQFGINFFSIHGLWILDYVKNIQIRKKKFVCPKMLTQQIQRYWKQFTFSRFFVCELLTLTACISESVVFFIATCERYERNIAICAVLQVIIWA